MALIDNVTFYLPDGYEDSEETFDNYLVPMGMFVVWAGKRGLLADSCFEGGNNFVDEVAAGELSCRDVTDFEFDGKLYDYHFSERGLPFAESYYKTGKYYQDLKLEFGSENEIPDDDASLKRVMEILDMRFDETTR